MKKYIITLIVAAFLFPTFVGAQATTTPVNLTPEARLELINELTAKMNDLIKLLIIKLQEELQAKITESQTLLTNQITQVANTVNDVQTQVNTVVQNTATSTGIGGPSAPVEVPVVKELEVKFVSSQNLQPYGYDWKEYMYAVKYTENNSPVKGVMVIANPEIYLLNTSRLTESPCSLGVERIYACFSVKYPIASTTPIEVTFTANGISKTITVDGK